MRTELIDALADRETAETKIGLLKAPLMLSNGANQLAPNDIAHQIATSLQPDPPGASRAYRDAHGRLVPKLNRATQQWLWQRLLPRAWGLWKFAQPPAGLRVNDLDWRRRRVAEAIEGLAA